MDDHVSLSNIKQSSQPPTHHLDVQWAKARGAFWAPPRPPSSARLPLTWTFWTSDISRSSHLSILGERVRSDVQHHIFKSWYNLFRLEIVTEVTIMVSRLNCIIMLLKIFQDQLNEWNYHKTTQWTRNQFIINNSGYKQYKLIKISVYKKNHEYHTSALLLIFVLKLYYLELFIKVKIIGQFLRFGLRL